jgi:hypothetical protein
VLDSEPTPGFRYITKLTIIELPITRKHYLMCSTLPTLQLFGNTRPYIIPLVIISHGIRRITSLTGSYYLLYDVPISIVKIKASPHRPTHLQLTSIPFPLSVIVSTLPIFRSWARELINYRRFSHNSDSLVSAIQPLQRLKFNATGCTCW